MRQMQWPAAAVLVWTTACAGQPAGEPTARKEPIPLAELARAAEKELGAMLEVRETDRATREAMGAVNGALVKSGLARGLPNLPTPEDAEACFRNAAANHGLAVTSIRTQVPKLTDTAQGKLKPGDRWQVKRDDLLGQIHMEVEISGPLPTIAAVIDEQAQCNRLIAVRGATVKGSTVTLQADAWFERNLAQPELDLRWRPLDERLIAAGWKPTDPALAQDPAFGQLQAAVNAGREQLPRVRGLLKTSVELPRWITRARELIVLKQEVLQIRGAKLLGLNQG